MVAQLRRGGDAVHVAHDRVRRLAVNGRLIQGRGLIHTLEIEADDLLRLAVFLDLEVVGREPANHFSCLLVADDHVGQHQVAIHFESEGPSLRRVLRSDRHHGQGAQQGDEAAQVTCSVHRSTAFQSSRKPHPCPFTGLGKSWVPHSSLLLA